MNSIRKSSLFRLAFAAVLIFSILPIGAASADTVSVDADGITINSSDIKSIDISGSDLTIGVRAINGGSATLNGMSGDIKTTSTANSSYAIYSTLSGDITISGLQSVDVTAPKDAVGIYAFGHGIVNVTMNGSMDVTSNNNHASGISSYSGSSTTVTGLKDLIVSGKTLFSVLMLMIIAVPT